MQKLNPQKNKNQPFYQAPADINDQGFFAVFLKKWFSQ